MEQIQVVNNNGSSKINDKVSTEEWIEILQYPKATSPTVWKALLGFYYKPNHTATCTEVGNELGSKHNSPSAIITNWSKSILKDKKFPRKPINDNHGGYWSMIVRKKDDGYYDWTIKPELVEAIKILLAFQDKLIQEAIEQYKQKLREDPSYWAGSVSEPNQRVAIANFQNHWRDVQSPDFANMFKEATAKAGNLLDSVSQPRNMILISAKYKPQEIKEMFQKLYENNDNFDLNDKDSVSRVRKSIEDFIQEAKNLTPVIKNIEKPDQDNYSLYQDINPITTYLWFRYPDKYYKYAYERYCIVKQKLGFYQYDIKKGSVDSVFEGFAMYDEIRAILRNDKELVDLINALIENSGFEYKDPEFRAATIDFGYFVSEYFQSKLQLTSEIKNMSNKNPNQDIVDLLKFKKNVILQGAPGTGKTYSTAAIALGILGVENVDFNNHPAVMKKYEELRDKERIFFTTFHQSMDYEDFVEGFKPEIIKESAANTEENTNSNNNNKNVGVTYICKPGIFKKACQAARVGQEFSKLLDEFLNSVIGVENKKEIPTITGKSRIYVWWNRGNQTVFIKPVLSTSDRPFVAAPNIGRIISQAANEEDPENQEPNYPSYSQAIIDYVSKEYGKDIPKETKNNVVLIIDEINRGNVSKIFGELVTLLEKDKRDGGDHPITVTLPYSKEKFSVPSNVYIIGTMNTTDRSTGTIDYAVRRRFAFVTLKADENVLPENSKARALFKNIEAFIKKYCPKDMDIADLMVGHSYFMAEKDDDLKLKIKYEVIPLLKEYCNDGLLTCSQKTLDDHIKKWVNLELFGNSETPSPAATEQDDDEDQE